MTESIPLTSHQQDFLRGFFSQYDVKGVPLEYTDYLSDGTTSSTFTTSAIASEAVPPDFWAYPTKYTLSKNVKDVFASNHDIHKMGTVIKGLLGADGMKDVDLSRF
jgi:hypothetical protein